MGPNTCLLHTNKLSEYGQADLAIGSFPFYLVIGIYL